MWHIQQRFFFEWLGELLSKRFKALFETDDKSDDETNGRYTLENAESNRKNRIAKIYQWYDFIIGFAKGNPMDYERAGNHTFIEICVYNSYVKQFKNDK